MNRKTQPSPEDVAAAAKQTAAQDDEVPMDDRQLASSIAGVVVSDSPDVGDRPAALEVQGVVYLYEPITGDYVDEEGGALDLKAPPARKALFAWRKRRMEEATLEADAAAREEAGPEDVHTFHVKHPSEMAAFESGRRWVRAKDLEPGIGGNEGIGHGHGVLIAYRDPSDDRLYQLQYRVLHLDPEAELVSLEPGERVGGDGVVFYPKGHVRNWLEMAAAVEGTTVERFVRKRMHQEYAVSPLRGTGTDTGGFSGRLGGNDGVLADLEAGRRARAGSK